MLKIEIKLKINILIPKMTASACISFFEQLNDPAKKPSDGFDVNGICLVTGHIQNFQLHTLPAAKKFWARTGNWKALKHLIDASDTPVSYEKEIEWAYIAGQYKTCCKLISHEILVMDRITEDARYDQVE
jgi:hypothetical protein